MRNWTWAHSVGLALIIALTPTLAWWGMAGHRPATAWIVIAILILVFAMIAGHGVVGAWRGVLIDDRNVISLSRFQMLLWTVIVLSGFIVAAFCNLYVGVESPLAIQVPNTLWLLMGISTTSLVGTPLVLNQKKNKQPLAQSFNETVKLLADQGMKPADVINVGQVIGNARPSLALWSDMFTGDETSNGAHLDLSKVQMFFFTLIIALTYCAAWLQMFRYSESGGVGSFPGLDESVLALIGISHSGYLVSKATPRG